MKNLKNIIALIVFFFATNVIAQRGGSNKNYNLNKSITVYTPKLKNSQQKMDEFISTHSQKLLNSEMSENHLRFEFVIDKFKLKELDSLVATFGYLSANNYSTANFDDKIEQLKNELADEQEKLAKYSIKPDTNTYKNYIFETERTISRLKKSIREINVNDSLVLVNVYIYNEMSTPNSSGNSRVSFVNMPGFEVGYLFVENPKAGLSSTAYQSFTCKYMFTRGKSYINLGVFKDANVNATDSSRIRELFLINFGQDFYPRHFGRGKRQFLNLYTGYQLGGFITNRNNDNTSSFIPNANVSLGLEFYKSKYILLDNKVSYFLPLNDLNRNLRGILYNISLNFVF
jgi:hypothetical protein